jgi:hypothetical protein
VTELLWATSEEAAVEAGFSAPGGETDCCAPAGVKVIDPAAKDKTNRRKVFTVIIITNIIADIGSDERAFPGICFG